MDKRKWLNMFSILLVRVSPPVCCTCVLHPLCCARVLQEKELWTLDQLPGIREINRFIGDNNEYGLDLNTLQPSSSNNNKEGGGSKHGAVAALPNRFQIHDAQERWKKQHHHVF